MMYLIKLQIFQGSNIIILLHILYLLVTGFARLSQTKPFTLLFFHLVDFLLEPLVCYGVLHVTFGMAVTN